MKFVWILLTLRLLIPYNFSLPNTDIRFLNVPGFEQEVRTVEDTIENGTMQQASNNEKVEINVEKSTHIDTTSDDMQTPTYKQQLKMCK